MRTTRAAARLVFALTFALAGPAAGQTPMNNNTTPQAEVARLRQFLADDWGYWMREYPELATWVGFPGQNGRWTDNSSTAIARRNQHLREVLKTLQGIDRARLPEAERLNYDLYRQSLELAIEGLQFHYDALPFPQVVPHSLAMPVSQIEGVQQSIPSVIAIMPTEKRSDYDDILSRLEGVPTLVDQTIALMQEGLRQGLTPPKIILRDVPRQVQDQIVADPLASPLLRAFRNFPAIVPPAEQQQLIRRAADAYTTKVIPAFRKLRDFLTQTYLPACRERVGADALPGGDMMYAYNVRWHTTTDLTSQQIHEIGLAEVRQIRAEMEKLIAAARFHGTFKEFSEFLRTDPRFYFGDAESLVKAYRDISKRADPQLAHLFGKLPRLPYGVIPVPDYSAPSQTMGYYEAGSLRAGRPGYYFVNTYNLKARPAWEMETLTLHEAVPGHHLQLALAQELEGVPEFRKHLGYGAFVEGWALYAESLGSEMGFFTDPYSRFGRLTYEMWRAVRLVVDTGLHARGWSRDQALQFFRENTSKTDQDITVEVDRYIAWPGQALAYKIGERKILELRSFAERTLGEQFRLRDFHDAILAEGAVPLDVLDARIRRWVADQKRDPAQTLKQ